MLESDLANSENENNAEAPSRPPSRDAGDHMALESKLRALEARSERIEAQLKRAEVQNIQLEERAVRAEARAQKGEERAERAERALSRSEMRAKEAEARATQAEARAHQADLRLQQLEAKQRTFETRAATAEARALEAERKIQVLLLETRQLEAKAKHAVELKAQLELAEAQVNQTFERAAAAEANLDQAERRMSVIQAGSRRSGPSSDLVLQIELTAAREELEILRERLRRETRAPDPRGQGALASMKARCDALEAAIAYRDSELLRLRAQHGRLLNDFEEARAELGRHSSPRGELRIRGSKAARAQGNVPKATPEHPNPDTPTD